jgi:hypothetical protein
MQQELVTGIALGLLTVAILSGVYWLNLPEPESEENYDDLLKSAICIYALQGIVSDYHYHLWLNITANGDRVEIPANVGFEYNDDSSVQFIHPIHTYDNSGQVHVETIANATVTLGDFFAIWEQPFSSEEVLDYTVDDTHTLRMTVDGTDSQVWEAQELGPYLVIEIFYEAA